MLTPSHEAIVLMQGGGGMDVGTTHVLASSAAALNAVSKLQDGGEWQRGERVLDGRRRRRVN